jgi:hypothetical protein
MTQDNFFNEKLIHIKEVKFLTKKTPGQDGFTELYNIYQEHIMPILPELFKEKDNEGMNTSNFFKFRRLENHDTKLMKIFQRLKINNKHHLMQRKISVFDPAIYKKIHAL